jgi:hypothetical protein
MSNNGAAEVAAGAIMGIYEAYDNSILGHTDATAAAKAAYLGALEPGIDWSPCDIGDYDAFAKAMTEFGLCKIKKDEYGDDMHVFIGDDEW